MGGSGWAGGGGSTVEKYGRCEMELTAFRRRLKIYNTVDKSEDYK